MALSKPPATSSGNASEGQQALGLFPLGTVLVPGGIIGLRVFETRYLDLVRHCGRNDDGFGVCLVFDDAQETADDTDPDAATANEASATGTVTAAFGTEARIEDFGSGDDGLLTIRVRGHRRFKVRDTRVRDNGLIVATVDWCDPDPDDELRPQHAVLGILLEGLLEQVGGEHAQAPSRCFDDAAWIGWRLAELLPLTDRQRQALLQEDDPHARLDSLLHLIP